MAQSKQDELPINVISLFGARPEMEEDEVAVGVEILEAPQAALKSVKSRVDLSGRPKVWFTVGRGKTGKTTLLRFAAEEAASADRRILVADVDRANATLSSYFHDVERPPAGDEATVTAWLEKLLTFVMARKATALIDLGGGDTTLRRLVSEVPDLVPMLERDGIAAVAIYMLGPQPDDLAPLASLEAAGFRPGATLLVLNEGLTEITGLARGSFRPSAAPQRVQGGGRARCGNGLDAQTIACRGDRSETCVVWPSRARRGTRGPEADPARPVRPGQSQGLATSGPSRILRGQFVDALIPPEDVAVGAEKLGAAIRHAQAELEGPSARAVSPGIPCACHSEHWP